MDKAKIQLSAKEAELVVNADWILTKNGILQKVKYLLEEVQSREQDLLQTDPSRFPVEITQIPPKISRGENYKGLPWLVLDYPRYFGKEDQFAIRSMFWWGNFFSITLHLAGRYKKMYEAQLADCFTSLKTDLFFIGTSNEQWEHHFESSNYLPLTGMGEGEFIARILRE